MAKTNRVTVSAPCPFCGEKYTTTRFIEKGADMDIVSDALQGVQDEVWNGIWRHRQSCDKAPAVKPLPSFKEMRGILPQ